MSDLKTVLIIGASAAGSLLARTLEHKLPNMHRIILVEANDYSFWPISSLRSAVVPGWEGKSLKSLQGFFPSGSRHVLLSGTKVVELGDGFVYVDCSHPELGFPSERIEFDICVLAIGSLYPFPMRPHSTTLIEAKQSYLESQIKIKGFQNIVLVGGGACSIEYAGEIISRYPSKSVTIIQSSHRLLRDPTPTKYSDKLLSELERYGVRVVFGERVPKELMEAGQGRVELKDGMIIEADLIINGAGMSINSSLVSAIDSGAVNNRGLITVDENLRIISSKPYSPLVTSTYFAVGDCSSSPGHLDLLKVQSDVQGVSYNLLASISSSPLRPAPRPLDAMGINIGPWGGASLLPFIGILGPWATGVLKGRGLLLGKFEKVNRQDQN